MSSKHKNNEPVKPDSKALGASSYRALQEKTGTDKESNAARPINKVPLPTSVTTSERSTMKTSPGETNTPVATCDPNAHHTKGIIYTKLRDQEKVLFSGLSKIYDRFPLTFKLMAWYTIFLSLIVILLSVFVFQFTQRWETSQLKDALQSTTVNMADDIHQFKPFSNGIFFLVYSDRGVIIKGAIPDGFPGEAPLSPHHITEISINRSTYYYYDSPFQIAGFNGWLRGIAPIRDLTKKTAAMMYGLILAGFLFLAVGSIGGYLLIKRGLRPLHSIAQTARDIGAENNLSRRLLVTDTMAKDEIYELSITLNSMLDSLEDMSNREKQFSSDISHELRTPIAVIQAESEFGKKYSTTIEEAKEGFNHIFEQSRLMTSLISQLLDIARLDHAKTLQLEALDVSSMLSELEQDYLRICKTKHITIDFDIAPHLVVEAQSVALRRAIGNLIDNAIKFTTDSIQVKARRDTNTVVITVSDNGIGIEKENLHKIWERLYQTETSRSKKDNQGVGLGLYFVNKVVHLHNGTTSVQSTIGKGATFEIRLPSCE